MRCPDCGRPLDGGCPAVSGCQRSEAFAGAPLRAPVADALSELARTAQGIVRHAAGVPGAAPPIRPEDLPPEPLPPGELVEMVERYATGFGMDLLTCLARLLTQGLESWAPPLAGLRDEVRAKAAEGPLLVAAGSAEVGWVALPRPYPLVSYPRLASNLGRVLDKFEGMKVVEEVDAILGRLSPEDIEELRQLQGDIAREGAHLTAEEVEAVLGLVEVSIEHGRHDVDREPSEQARYDRWKSAARKLRGL